jgi:hypothetical protein
MAIGSGIGKQLRYKRESSWGVPPGATAAQLLRRKTSDLNVVKTLMESQELRSDYGVVDVRHGVRSVQGTIMGELSCLTYADFMLAALRADPAAWVAAPATTALTNVTATATAPQFVRATGSFLTDGFKVGMIVRWTGWAAGATANNARNFLITALTATQMTGVFLDGTAVVAKASGDSVTCTGFKVARTPESGSTFYDTSFSIEHWFSDIAQSELYLGCKVSTLGFKIPGNDVASLDVGIIGKDSQNATAQYFTTPTAETTKGILTCLSGSLFFGGTKYATVTNAEIDVNGGHQQSEPVLGSNAVAAVFPGRVRVTGRLQVYWEDATFRDAFLNETSAALVLALASGNLATSEAMALVMPKVKLNGSAKDDGEKGLLQTVPFMALVDATGGTGTATHRSALYVCDTEIP